MEIDIGQIGRQEKYKLLIGSVVPRPIAWVSSISRDEVVNVAPFSYFNVACIDPMMVSVAVARKPGSVPKDTSRNIQETGQFVINMVDVHNVEAVNQSSADYPPEISEAEAIGLTLIPSKAVKVPRIGESRIHFECKLHQVVTLGEPAASDLIIGEVVYVHIDDELYFDGKIDVDKYAPVSRMAGHSYAKIGEMFDRPRPVYEKKE
ncbi:flavin reductase family protein [Brevibacillus humidisoli]|uniref:flavin reductase family protein n=1 Tax=Brevibacillus humidisoli TaxID=2895522 RepID=UPI001E30151A|nr:flavin reductase family protein [Brevibacillus humidisoli]UFJ41634.1 flavin reductase family protein [Brevibacillus humidisoli]